MNNVEKLMAVIDADDPLSRYALADALEEEGRDAEAAWFRAWDGPSGGGGPDKRGGMWCWLDTRFYDPARCHRGSVLPIALYGRLRGGVEVSRSIRGYRDREEAVAALVLALGLGEKGAA